MNAEFQRVIFEALVADSAVSATVSGRVYDNVPVSPVFPYVSFGPADSYPDDEECIDATVETLQVDVWSQDHGRLGPCKQIVRALYDALHEAELSMSDPWALAEVRVTSTRVFRDADNITAHGIVIVEGRIES